MSDLPFRGLSFTSTQLGVSRKSAVFDMVHKMGGKTNNDLTAETKVLIVGNLNTEKVRYCLEKRSDVTLVYPEDIIDIYSRFQNGEKLSAKCLDDYPWPIFNNSLFCLSRLNDVRNECYLKPYIYHLITKFGGNSTSALSQDVKYLITDKKEGKRYSSAIKWKILTIHPKWIIDCCNCQRLLDPRMYDISEIDDISKIGMGSYQKPRNIVDYGKTTDNPFWADLTKKLKGSAFMEKQIQKQEQSSLLFKGFIFYYFGFDTVQAEKLSKIMKENGAEVQDVCDLSITHIIIPSSFTASQISEKIQRMMDISDVKLVNEWFIERCLYYKKISNDSWSKPVKKLYLDYHLKIHITGFLDIEYMHLSKLIKNLNLTLCKELSADVNFLISNLSLLGLDKTNSPQLFDYPFKDLLSSKCLNSNSSLTKKKINSAKKWNIPVLSLAFLWELAQTGILPNVLDPRWCIFAPRTLIPVNNFLEYSRNVSGRTYHTQKGENERTDLVEDSNGKGDREEDKEEGRDGARRSKSGNHKDSLTVSPVKLPKILLSPRKSRVKRYSKLHGFATESQLKSMDSLDSFDDVQFNGSKRKLSFSELDKGSEYVQFRHEDRTKHKNDDDIPTFKRSRFYR